MKFKVLNMKKLIVRVLPLMFALVLVGCNEKSVNDISSDVPSEEEITEEKTTEAAKDTYTVTDTYTEQIQLFAEQKDMWLPEDFEPYAASVAIYDLDGDGILELMTTVTQGTGLYAYNNFYQADVENGRILELGQGPKEELAYGRLGFELASYGYERRNKAYMDENGRIYYPAVDYGRAGIAFSSCTEGVYYLENGVIMNEAIRSHTTDFTESEDGVETYYVYDEAEPVTEEEWETAYEEFAKGKVPQKINIAWKDFYEEEMRAISEVEWVEILTTSWQQAETDSMEVVLEDIKDELSIEEAYAILNSDTIQGLLEIEVNRQEVLDRKQQFNNTLDMVLEEYSGQLFPEDLIMECQKALHEVFEKGADVCDEDGAYVQWLNLYGAEEYILSLADICELVDDFEKENITDIYEAYELISGFENCTSIFWMKRDSGEDTFLLCVDSGGSYGIYNIYLAELVNGNLVVRDSFEAQGEGLGRVIKDEQSYYYLYLQYNKNLKNYDGVKIHKLEQNAEQENILIRYIPKEFVVENLSVSDIDANEKIESYIQEIKTDLRNGKYLDAGNGEDWDCLMGDEVLDEQFPLTSEFEKYVKADMANIGIDVYFQKKIFIPSNTAFSAYYKTDFYLRDVMTDELLKLDALGIKNMEKNQLVQLWSKKFDDLTYVFKIFHLVNYEYVLDVSLMKGNDITSIRTDVILPMCRFELVEGNVEVY